MIRSEHKQRTQILQGCGIFALALLLTGCPLLSSVKKGKLPSTGTMKQSMRGAKRAARSATRTRTTRTARTTRTRTTQTTRTRTTRTRTARSSRSRSSRSRSSRSRSSRSRSSRSRTRVASAGNTGNRPKWNKEKTMPNTQAWLDALEKRKVEMANIYRKKHGMPLLKYTPPQAGRRRRRRRRRRSWRSRKKKKKRNSAYWFSLSPLYAQLQTREVPKDERLENIKFPVDPVALDCNHPNLTKSCGRGPKSVRICASWGKDRLKKARTQANMSSFASSATTYCGKMLWYYARAHCTLPDNPDFKKQWEVARDFCNTQYKYQWIQVKYRAQKQPVPIWSVSPAQGREMIRKTLRRGTLGRHLQILAFQPDNQEVKDSFDRKYSRFFGIRQSVAKKYREQNLLGGSLSKLTDAQLHQKAIDELLGKHHTYKNGKATFGLNYQEIHFLANRTFIPILLNMQDKFKKEQCAYNLMKKRKNFHGDAPNKAIKEGTRVCHKVKLRVKGFNVINGAKYRMRLIKLLAAKTADPQKSIREAAPQVVRQIGAKRYRFCWNKTNPFKIVRSSGPKASCYSFSENFGGGHVRYVNFAYTPIPLRKLTKFQIKEAREVLRIAGLTGGSLDKKLKRLYRRAKGYKCVAFNTSVVRHHQGRGRYGAIQHYGVGNNKTIPCSRVRKSRLFKKLYPTWTNYFDTVLGGRMFGPWRVIRQKHWPRRILRKTREAYVFVRRKI